MKKIIAWTVLITVTIAIATGIWLTWVNCPSIIKFIGIYVATCVSLFVTVYGLIWAVIWALETIIKSTPKKD